MQTADAVQIVAFQFGMELHPDEPGAVARSTVRFHASEGPSQCAARRALVFASSSRQWIVDGPMNADQVGHPPKAVRGKSDEGPCRDTYLACFKCCRRSRVQDVLDGRRLHKDIS